MKLLLILSVLILSSSAIASERFYDSRGQYQGWKTDEGRYYNKHGRFTGREDKDGRYYDHKGQYRGRVVLDKPEKID